uniref:HAT C-terminal dimerisation domain-containing protein n=1 Tax=Cacopsylla melanoneura TaxID=428564 RepID=A0A8D8VNZ1_9HEMI
MQMHVAYACVHILQVFWQLCIKRTFWHIIMKTRKKDNNKNVCVKKIGFKKMYQKYNNISASKVSKFKFCPMASVDVERSFSSYKYILDDRRHRFTIESLRNIMVVHFNEIYAKYIGIIQI